MSINNIINRFPKKFLLCFLTILFNLIFLLSGICVMADNVNTVEDSNYSVYDYVIDKYDVDIVVNENNTFNVTEKITTNFLTDKHGIYRIIPLSNTVVRQDGTSSKNRAQVTDIDVVNNKYSLSRENGNIKIKIGDANRTFTGRQSYVIRYTYNIGKDPNEKYDELYYNIIGENWDTKIDNVSFSITMPKDFDVSKIGFSSGKVGSVENDGIQYIVNNNKITGTFSNVLYPGEALTVRCELPDGYFVGAGLKTNIMDYVFLISLLFLGVAILLWYRFGRDEKVVETVEFYPPEGYNSLEIGYLYKGKADEQDVTSLLIYLANKGYIKIEETEDKILFFKSKGFKITKLKEYDGNNVNEALFLNGLFASNSSVNIGNLYNKFYITTNKILSNINNKENKNKIFEKSTFIISFVIVSMIIATFCLITIPPVYAYVGYSDLFFALLFPGLGFSFMFKLLFSKNQTIYINGKASHSSIGSKLFGLVWGIMFGGIPWAMIVLPLLLQNPIYLIGYVVGLVCVFGMILCLNYMPKRTSYGNEILGKIKGFKNFLQTVEKDKLETMVFQDPTYFYDILPFAYVLGVSDKWIKNFESITVQAPSWYDSREPFSVNTFGVFIGSAMASAQNVVSSSPSSSSSSHSGGGHSGGGSGGGGGGSW